MKNEFKLLAWGLNSIINTFLALSLIVGCVIGLVYIFSSKVLVLTIASVMIMVSFWFFCIAYKQHYQ
ncbi:hypothetical protein [Actinobacillus minor]|uniref:hypothetical protein n=1 Tax=Actinobacillus minor TaxID=51047 RepID=UPI0023F57461|nr:hypothetical protein [Actinobacillus minor]MDD6911607.1 hypothetical protein [Actinobacillus minor]